MISKQDILTLTHRVMSRTHTQRTSHALLHPMRDWWITILASVVVFLAGGAWITYQYIQYQTIDSVPGKATSQVPHYQESQVLDALDFFRARRSEYRALIGTLTVPVSTSTASTTPVDRATTTPLAATSSSTGPQTPTLAP